MYVCVCVIQLIHFLCYLSIYLSFSLSLTSLFHVRIYCIISISFLFRLISTLIHSSPLLFLTFVCKTYKCNTLFPSYLCVPSNPPCFCIGCPCRLCRLCRGSRPHSLPPLPLTPSLPRLIPVLAFLFVHAILPFLILVLLFVLLSCVSSSSLIHYSSFSSSTLSSFSFSLPFNRHFSLWMVWAGVSEVRSLARL